MAFLHFNFTHIFFEANESLKYSARLQAALLKADIFTHSGTLSLRMKSLYLAVESCVCVCVYWPFVRLSMCVCVKKRREFGILSVQFRVVVCLCCVKVCELAHAVPFFSSMVY